MQNIDITVANNARNMLPVPIPNNPVPTIDSPLNYGNSPYPMPLKPSSRKDDESQYCNTLSPAPRDQRLNVPYEGNKNCPEFEAQPYKKDSCYLYNSKAQGVTGIVCNEAGGSDNANFERGNQFGVDYPFDFKQRMNDKRLEYTVEIPVQVPMELQNPMVLYDKSTFYPEKNYFLRGNPDYMTYPLPDNYTDTGIPTYTYPYKTMNPAYGNPGYGNPAYGNSVKQSENFSNINSFTKMSNSTSSGTNKFFFFMLLLIIICVILCMYRIC